MKASKKLQNPSTNNVFVNATMMPLETVLCQDMALKVGSDSINNVIISNGKIVNLVSDSYGFIKNQDFFGGFEEILKSEHIKYEMVQKNYADRQFTVDYILEGELFVNSKFAEKYKNSDMIKPKLRLTNSYDGKVNLAGYFGFFRQVCSNGLHVSTNDLAFNIRKTKKNLEIVFPSMTEMLENYKKNDMVKIFRKFEVLAEKTIKKEELNHIIKNLSTNIFMFEKSEKNHEPSINANFVLDVIARESDLLKVKPNAWIVYNAMNELIYSDDRNKKTDSQRRSLDVNLFANVEELFLV
jgi:hypothetical protein